jgi:ferric-dicitrate binding protein FerR (iron transport regulator)
MPTIDEQHFKQLLDAYLQGKSSPAETKLLDDFFDTYPQARRQSLNADEAAREAIWQKLVSKLPEPARQNRTRMFSATSWYSIAAVFALFVTVSIFLIFKSENGEQKPDLVAMQMQQAVTVRGQKLKVELLDGTRVILNANSKLEFPEQFNGHLREVYLEGEAYFQVAHDADHPFIVHTSAASTTVLGTSFNVKLTEGQGTQVTLVDGKVDVATLPGKSRPAQHIILMPNQQAVITNGNDRIDVRNVDVSAFVDWKDNILRFDNLRLDEAVALIEDWYNVDITLKDPALANCTINATYRRETLKNVLASLGYMLKVTYHQDGKNITLQGRGCKGSS